MPDEQAARGEIDRLLSAAGWVVCDVAQANIHAGRGVALREFALADGHGFADSATMLHPNELAPMRRCALPQSLRAGHGRF
jgi:hypothetical protein